MNNLNKKELEIQARYRESIATNDDVGYLLEKVLILQTLLHKEEFERMEIQDNYEMLERVNNYKKLVNDRIVLSNSLLLNDKNYLVNVLESISRIAISDDKGDPDLDKIKNLADEALEAIK